MPHGNILSPGNIANLCELGYRFVSMISIFQSGMKCMKDDVGVNGLILTQSHFQLFENWGTALCH